MFYVFPPDLERLVREELATGVYASEDEVLMEAMRAFTSGMRQLPAFKRAFRTWNQDGCDHLMPWMRSCERNFYKWWK